MWLEPYNGCIYHSVFFTSSYLVNSLIIQCTIDWGTISLSKLGQNSHERRSTIFRMQAMSLYTVLMLQIISMPIKSRRKVSSEKYNMNEIKSSKGIGSVFRSLLNMLSFSNLIPLLKFKISLITEVGNPSKQWTNRHSDYKQIHVANLLVTLRVGYVQIAS